MQSQIRSFRLTGRPNSLDKKQKKKGGGGGGTPGGGGGGGRG
eukprot:SAG31_NODE_4677_length_3040_cov_3.849031_1_plen_41_part_10